MTERDLSKQMLSEKLDRLCSGGAADEIIDDAFVDALMEWLGPVEKLSDEATHYAVTQLQAAMKDEAVVASLRNEHGRATGEKTFGQLMNEVRTKAGWNLATVAQRLGKDSSFVDRLERDLVPIVQLTVQQLADLLELFHVRLSEFLRLATRTSLAQELQRKVTSAHARSKTDATSPQHGRELAFAIARALPDFENSKSPPTLDQKLVDGLAAELRHRERADLLTE